ncbi:hypothetical protein ACIHFD_29470 [Nonomuraea sp. NPDC051941]
MQVTETLSTSGLQRRTSEDRPYWQTNSLTEMLETASTDLAARRSVLA